MVRRRVVAPLGVLAALAFVVGCGGEDDFENQSRQPKPVELTANVNQGRVTVSPDRIGAGLVNFTITNQSPDPARFVLEGPTDDASNEIPPGTVASLKSELAEGSYEVSAGEDSDARADTLDVGPPRATAQNDLLLP